MDFQRKLVDFALNNGGIIYGGFIYKKIIRGESTRDIDVKAKDKEHLNELSNKFQKEFDCKIVPKPKELLYAISTLPKEEQRKYLEASLLDCKDDLSDTRFDVDLVVDDNNKKENPIWNLEYIKNKNNSYSDNIISSRYMNEYELCETISDIKNKRYTPWEGMRNKDKEYFKDWRVKNSLADRFRKYCGSY